MTLLDLYKQIKDIGNQFTTWEIPMDKEVKLSLSEDNTVKVEVLWKEITLCQKKLIEEADKAKEIVIDSIKRIVNVEDAENWLQDNQTAYQLAMDVALHAYYQAKEDEAEK